MLNGILRLSVGWARRLTGCSFFIYRHQCITTTEIELKGTGSPYSIIDRRVSELIPVLGSEPAGDVTHVSHKPTGRLPLLSARPAVTLATLKRAATSFAAW